MKLGRKGQIGFYIKLLAVVIILIILYALMGDAWSTLFTSATDAANLTGGADWFFEHFPAVILVMATIILFIAGAVVLGGGDD